MSTLSSANVTDVDLVLKERPHMRLCINMLIFTHNLGNWLIIRHQRQHLVNTDINSRYTPACLLGVFHLLFLLLIHLGQFLIDFTHFALHCVALLSRLSLSLSTLHAATHDTHIASPFVTTSSSRQKTPSLSSLSMVR